MKGQDNLQNTSVNILEIIQKLIFTSTFGLNFHFINDRQPSKVLKSETVSRQKWKKLTVNRQSYHPNDILLIECVVPFKSVDKILRCFIQPKPVRYTFNMVLFVFQYLDGVLSSFVLGLFSGLWVYPVRIEVEIFISRPVYTLG